MLQFRDTIILRTHAPIEIIEITAQVRASLARSGLSQGLLTLFSAHTTAFVCLNEKETMLQQDMLDFLGGIAPPAIGYRHDQAPVDGRVNAHAHLIGLFMNASETIPVAERALCLGEWQSIFFVELDGPRPQRKVQLQMMGEG
ncbi:MAG: YjbQ family protein [Sphingobacteriia bacterium]|nr:YjbQ family protein [Sphingobacteriia bacterium]NCC38248.1 YjbQ family protein [Gammaproteobacteria bacterium]